MGAPLPAIPGRGGGIGTPAPGIPGRGGGIGTPAPGIPGRGGGIGTPAPGMPIKKKHESEEGTLQVSHYYHTNSHLSYKKYYELTP